MARELAVLNAHQRGGPPGPRFRAQNAMPHLAQATAYIGTVRRRSAGAGGYAAWPLRACALLLAMRGSNPAPGLGECWFAREGQRPPPASRDGASATLGGRSLLLRSGWTVRKRLAAPATSRRRHERAWRTPWECRSPDSVQPPHRAALGGKPKAPRSSRLAIAVLNCASLMTSFCRRVFNSATVPNVAMPAPASIARKKRSSEYTG